MARKVYRRNKKNNRKMRRRKGRKSQQIYHFKRSAIISTITASNDGTTAVPIRGGYVVALQQLPEYTDFTDLFQQYKINGAKLEFIPNGNMEQVSTVFAAAPTNWGQFGSALDFDDTTTPTAETEIMTSQTYRKTRATSVHSRYWRPKILREVYNGVLGNAFESCSARWLATAFPEVPHYGLKVWCDAPTIPSTASSMELSITYTVRLTLWFSCKNLQ